METYMCGFSFRFYFFLAMNFESFRVSVREALGFETFYPECLDDSVEMYAFLVPSGVSEEVRNQLSEYISTMFHNTGRICEGITWHDSGSYHFNWCGSRHISAQFDTHLVFWLAKPSEESAPLEKKELPTKPETDRWIIVEVNYDSVRHEMFPDSCMRFDSAYAAAAKEGGYAELKQRLTESVKDIIQRIYDTNA